LQRGRWTGTFIIIQICKSIYLRFTLTLQAVNRCNLLKACSKPFLLNRGICQPLVHSKIKHAQHICRFCHSSNGSTPSVLKTQHYWSPDQKPCATYLHSIATKQIICSQYTCHLENCYEYQFHFAFFAYFCSTSYTWFIDFE